MQAPGQNKGRTEARIEIHGSGVGSPSAEDVEQRAKELALIQGRDPEAVTKEDRQHALQELHGNGIELSAEESHSDMVASSNPADIAVETGRKKPAVKPADEQQIIEKAIKEGMREAEHERLVEGHNQTDEH